MSDYGMKISKEDLDVLTSKQPRDYLFWSSYKQLKITKYIRGMLAITASSASVNITHGLGYVPAFMAWFDLENNSQYWLPYTYQGANSDFTHKNCDASADISQITLSVNRGTDGVGSYNIPYTCIIFDQPIDEVAAGNDKPIGYQTSDYGIKVSIPGKDVTTAKIYEQNLNSNCDTLKYHATMEGKTIAWDSVNGSKANVEYVHGLGYVPLWLGFMRRSSDSYDYVLPYGRSPAPVAISGFADKNRIVIEDITSALGEAGTTGTNEVLVVIFKNNMLN